VKIKWIKTYTMSGSLEVPDEESEETQKQMARDHAADTDITIAELDWSETQFFSTKPQYEGDVAYLENDEDKFYNWFRDWGW
jgi:hypothetical protein